MSSKMEIDFLDLNSIPQSEKGKRTTASGIKWPFSSMPELGAQPENTYFQNCNSTPILFSDSNCPLLNNYKESEYFGGAPPIVTTNSTHHSRNVSYYSRQPSTLTIFYLGEVYVFQDIAPEKAELILDMASKSINLPMNEILEEANKEITEENKSEPSKSNAYTNNAKGALAIARRATLARFLEKRKHRLIKAGPYECGEKLSKFLYDVHLDEETASSSVHWES